MGERVYMPKSDWVDACDAVREKLYSTDTYTSGELGDKIREIDTGKISMPFDWEIEELDYYSKTYPEELDEAWVRPNEWPDLSTMTLGENELWFTMLNKGEQDFASFTCLINETSGMWHVQAGSIENGVFVPLNSEQEIAQNTLYTTYYNDEWPEYVVYHVWTEDNFTIKRFYFGQLISKDGLATWPAWMNPCIERYSWLPNANALTYESNRYWCSVYLVHDYVKGITSTCTSCSYAYDGATFMRKPEFVDCDFSGVTTFNYMFNYNYSITSVDFTDCTFGGPAQKASLTCMFRGCHALRNVYMPTSNDLLINATNCDTIFSECWSLTEIDLSWLGFQYCTTFNYFFGTCYNLESITWSGEDAIALTTCSNMYNGCRKLKEIDNSHIKSASITNMSSMFNGCYNVEYINLNGMVTDNVTTFANMFNSCYRVKKIDFNTFKPLNATTVDSMFAYCYCLEELNLGPANIHSAPLMTNINSMFYQCRRIKSLTFDGFSCPSVTSCRGMFYDCESLEYLSLKDLNLVLCTSTTNVSTSYSPMFYQCWSLREVYLDGMNPNQAYYYKTSSSATIYGLFHDAKAIQKISLKNSVSSTLNGLRWFFYGYEYTFTQLRELDFSNCEFTRAAGFDLGSAFTGLITVRKIDFTGSTILVSSLYNTFGGCRSLEEIPGIGDLNYSLCTRVDSAFSNCHGLRSIDLHAWRLPLAVQCNTIFSNCYELEEVDLTGFEVSNNCTSLSSMFSNCYKLKSVSMPALSATSYVTTLNSMFYYCYNLESVYMPLVVTNRVTNFSSMFNSCWHIKSIDISGFNTSAATTYSSMFANCYDLEELDLHTMTTPSTLTDVGYMFSECRSLKSLNLGNMTFSYVTNFNYMFNNCSTIEEIDVSKFSVGSATSMAAMFNGCSSLKELDLSTWLPARVTNINSFVSSCCALEKLDLRNAVWSALATSNPGFLVNNSPMRYLRIGKPKNNINISNCRYLTHDNLVEIFNDLDTTSTQYTLTIGAQNLAKMSAADKLIVTNKNWKLA